jgi:hypothetical protein
MRGTAMQFRVGRVYRDKRTGVDFIAVKVKQDQTNNVLTFQLVNVINWIVLETVTGKVLSDGEISSNGLVANNYDQIATSLQVYYNQQDAEKK